MLELLATVLEHVKDVISCDGFRDLPGALIYTFDLMLDNARMLKWFVKDNPEIWPVEMRDLVRGWNVQPDWAIKAAGYKPMSEIAQKIHDARAAILRAEAEASAMPWETSNDAAVFVALRNMEITTTWLIKSVDKAIQKTSVNDIAEEDNM